MFRFTIRDVLWLMALVAFGCAWVNEHNARRAAEEDSRSLELWSKGLERAIENNGYYVDGAAHGHVSLDKLPPDFPKGLSNAERRRQLREWDQRNRDEGEVQ